MLCMQTSQAHRDLTYTTIRALVNPLKPVSLAPSEAFLFSVKCDAKQMFLGSE